MTEPTMTERTMTEPTMTEPTMTEAPDDAPLAGIAVREGLSWSWHLDLDALVTALNSQMEDMTAKQYDAAQPEAALFQLAQRLIHSRHSAREFFSLHQSARGENHMMRMGILDRAAEAHFILRVVDRDLQHPQREAIALRDACGQRAMRVNGAGDVSPSVQVEQA